MRVEPHYIFCSASQQPAQQYKSTLCFSYARHAVINIMSIYVSPCYYLPSVISTLLAAVQPIAKYCLSSSVAHREVLLPIVQVLPIMKYSPSWKYCPSSSIAPSRSIVHRQVLPIMKYCPLWTYCPSPKYCPSSSVAHRELLPIAQVLPIVKCCPS